MKKQYKIIALIVLAATAVALLTGCRPPNTVSSGTPYKLAMLMNVYPYEKAENGEYDLNAAATRALSDASVSGCAWAALKDHAKTTSDSDRTGDDKTEAVKYYVPSLALTLKNDNKSYGDKFTSAAQQQLKTAVETNKAATVVITSDEFAGAYAKVKDEKKYKDASFVIVTNPASDLLKDGAINSKTTAVVLQTEQHGYLFGYYAAEKGFKNIGYFGAEGSASVAFVTGLKKGAEAGGASVVDFCTSSGPNETVIKEDLEANIPGTVDLLIGDELTMQYVAASGKKYASICKDEKAEFSVTINGEVLTAKLKEAVSGARLISNPKTVWITAADGLFVYSGSTELVTVPEFSTPAAAASSDTTSETT